MALSLVIDHAQRRLRRDRLTLAAAGMELAGELDGATFHNTWIDPITYTLMLRPRPLFDDWYRQDTGEYAKLGLADFDLGTEWEERRDQSGKGPWLARASGPPTGLPAGGITTDTYTRNRGFWVAWFGYGAGEQRILLRCGWNDTADPGDGVALVFWSDGTAEILRDGSTQGYGRISGNRSGDIRSGQVYQLILLPMRGRELLVWSQFGNGFRHVFDGLDESDPTIIPAGKFWFDVPSGAAQVQIAPLRFPSEGYAHTVRTSWAEPPETDEESEATHLIAWPGFGTGEQEVTTSLVDWSEAPFVPDGVLSETRVRTDFSTTDPGYTPFLVGVQVTYAPQFENTADDEYSLTDLVTEAVLSVPEDPAGVAFDFTLHDPEGNFDERSWTSANRPFRATLGELTVFEGVVGGVSGIDAASEKARFGQWEVFDPFRVLAETRFRDLTPWDGRLLSDVIGEIAALSGVEAQTISESDFALPATEAWAVAAEVGDSAAEWLERLMDTFAPDWIYGFRPGAEGVEFFATKPEDLPTEPAITLKRTRTAPEDGVVRQWREEWLEPEANEVRVTGWDAAIRRPVEAVLRDADSANPATLPAERPENWLGATRRFGLVDPAITNQATADAVCAGLFAQKSRARRLAEFHTDALLAGDGRLLWRGDAVQIEGKGVYRIRSFGCRFVREEETLQWREAVYVAEQIGDEMEPS
ncbi:MAG: hypothetical protein KF812_02215 [Fimbriimonadaceae bacterium]|nr:hypothetical protein [Fimbriimonadaceae bacterium]